MARRPAARGIGGLRLNVVRGPHKADRRIWYWRIIDNRGGRRETLWSGWADEREAEAQLATCVASGGARVDTTRDETVQTVRDLLEVWIHHIDEERPDLAPRTVQAYHASGRRLVQLLGDVLLTALDTATVEGWAGAARRRWAPRTVAADVVTLGAAWSWGRRRGVCPPHELPRVRVTIPRAARRTPTDGELAAVIEAMRPPWARLALRLQWATGARIGEVLTLRWEQVDWSRGEILLTGKTGPRRVPVSDAVLDELRLWRMGCDADRPEVMPIGYETTRRSIYRCIDRACRRADVPRYTTHAIRRAVVDRLARSGVDVATAADILGHSPQVMLDAYRQVSDDDRREAVRRARLGALPEGAVIDLAERRR